MADAREELEALEELLERSIAQAGPFLRSSFQIPAHALSAAELVALFARSRTVALATVARDGGPRAAPIGALLAGACFWMPTVASAARCRHVLANPATSLTCFDADWAVIAHGTSRVVGAADDEFAGLEARARAAGLPSVLEWGEGVYLGLAPDRLFTWRREASARPTR